MSAAAVLDKVLASEAFTTRYTHPTPPDVYIETTGDGRVLDRLEDEWGMWRGQLYGVTSILGDIAEITIRSDSSDRTAIHEASHLIGRGDEEHLSLIHISEPTRPY